MCPSAVGHFIRQADMMDSKVRQENFWTVGMRDNDSDDWRLSGIGIATDEKLRGYGATDLTAHYLQFSTLSVNSNWSDTQPTCAITPTP